MLIGLGIGAYLFIPYQVRRVLLWGTGFLTLIGVTFSLSQSYLILLVCKDKTVLLI